MLEDPYPFYAELRKRQPVFWHEGMQSWLITRYDHCQDVLNNHELFLRDRQQVSGTAVEARQGVRALDSPQQVALRRLIVNSLNSQDFEQVALNVRGSVERFFETLASRSSFDWMSEVATPLAAAITAELLGVREPEPGTFKQVSEGIAQGYNADVRPETARVGEQARARLGALVEDAWQAAEGRRGAALFLKHNGDDLGFSERVMKETLGLLFNGSHSAIFAASGNITLTLLRRPDALERLRDPALLDTGIDELVRYEGPAQATSRVAGDDTKIGDVPIRAGDSVIALLAAANRDPAQFAEPDELILDRKPNKHLGFGWGLYACVGSLFGRLALRELVTGLHNAPTSLRLAGEPVRLNATAVRSLEKLPVTFQD
jgi:cytochrome P450